MTPAVVDGVKQPHPHPVELEAVKAATRALRDLLVWRTFDVDDRALRDRQKFLENASEAFGVSKLENVSENLEPQMLNAYRKIASIVIDGVTLATFPSNNQQKNSFWKDERKKPRKKARRVNQQPDQGSQQEATIGPVLPVAAAEVQAAIRTPLVPIPEDSQLVIDAEEENERALHLAIEESLRTAPSNSSSSTAPNAKAPPKASGYSWATPEQIAGGLAQGQEWAQMANAERQAQAAEAARREREAKAARREKEAEDAAEGETQQDPVAPWLGSPDPQYVDPSNLCRHPDLSADVLVSMPMSMSMTDLQAFTTIGMTDLLFFTSG